MTLFLVTRNDHYYPREGVGDFLFISEDPVKAREYFDQIEVRTDINTIGQDKFLIQLTERGWSVLERASTGE